MLNIFQRDFGSELEFNFSRSSGPGGQHVNKTESKVELRFNISRSDVLSLDEKEKIKIKLGNRINQEGYLILHCQETRSQLKNKEFVIFNFYKLLNEALRIQKIRKPTRPTRMSIEKRLESKRQLSEKKRRRREL